ncbi:hypothetical protein CAPTEDRAFT_117311, partial [Capitella teleta]
YKTSCQELKARGVTRSGVYRLDLSSFALGLFDVSCDMESDGGGWMVVQRRQDGSVDFYRGWQDYAGGFGNINSEFWLGNDMLHIITTTKPHKLRVDLGYFDGVSVYADYSDFSVAGANDFYRLHCKGYSGTAGDDMKYNDGCQFTTKDEDHDTKKTKNCAVSFLGAWWYPSDPFANLNGKYGKTTHMWFNFRRYSPLKFTEMKIQAI